MNQMQFVFQVGQMLNETSILFENSECYNSDCPINVECEKYWKVNYLSASVLDQSINIKCTGEWYLIQYVLPSIARAIIEILNAIALLFRFDWLPPFSMCKPQMLAIWS